MTTIDKQDSSFASCPNSPSIPPINHVSSLVLREAVTEEMSTWQLSYQSLEEGNLLLPAAWGQCPHHQTKLANVELVSLPPAEAEDVESNPAQPTRTITATFLIQTALLRANLRKSHNLTVLLKANLRKSSETTFALLTTHSRKILWDDVAATNTNCRPNPAWLSSCSSTTKLQY